MFPSLRDVHYSEARPEIQDGDTLFCQGNSIFSKLIRKFTGEISHTGKIFLWGHRRVVLESVEGHGTRFVPLSWYVDNYNGGLLIGRPDDLDAEKSLAWCQEHTPRPYDWNEIYRITLRRFKVSRRTKVVDNDSRICSEFVADADEAGGVVHQYNSGGYITPTDIWNSSKVSQIFRIKG